LRSNSRVSSALGHIHVTGSVLYAIPIGERQVMTVPRIGIRMERDQTEEGDVAVTERQL
jgi:hypothetical protein